MSFTVFLGNLPTWVTADDIKGWLTAENLVADAIKVIRNPETQESKGFAFIEAPNTEEMNSIIRRFDRAPLEDRLLRANPAQPARPKGATPGGRPMGGPGGPGSSQGAPTGHSAERGPERASSAGPRASHTEGHSVAAPQSVERRPPPPPRRAKKTFVKRSESRGPQSSFAEELAKAL
jgi:RNA recognition motif-containing protein